MDSYSTEIAVSKTARGIAKGKTYRYLNGSGHTHTISVSDVGDPTVTHAGHVHTYGSTFDAAKAFVAGVGEDVLPTAESGYRQVILQNNGQFYFGSVQAAA